MLDWNLLFQNGLIYGVVLSVIITVLMVISGLIALDMFVGDYPPAIREKYGLMSPRARRLRPYVAALLFIIFFAVPVVGLLRLRTEFGSIGFLPAFVFAFMTMLVFNIYDLVILDWLIFCTLQPRIMVLPGTEGMPAYRDYRFHFIGFLKGLGFVTLGSLISAGLWMAIQWFTLSG